MSNNIQNRRLVRPKLSDSKSSPQAARATRKKQVPPERTNAESFYYIKQMNNHTPMKVILMDGEVLEGHIEWYDKHCLKINRDVGPNLLVMKSCIKYMFKANEEDEDKYKAKEGEADQEFRSATENEMDLRDSSTTEEEEPEAQ